VYIVGEFRRVAAAAPQNVTITLKCNRGATELCPPISATMTAEKVPEFLLAAAKKLALSPSDRATTPSESALPKVEQSAAQAKEEAALLHERGKSFALVGDWQRALAMLEASLLVDSSQPSAHLDAFKVLRHLPEGVRYYRWGTDKEQWEEANGAASLGYLARRTDHLESFLRFSSFTWENIDERIELAGIVESAQTE
jgi:hypothetical protein